MHRPIVVSVIALLAIGVACSKPFRAFRRDRGGARAQAGAVALSRGFDPGPRGGAPSGGSFFATLRDSEQALFARGLATFKEVASVSGTMTGEPGIGLGPTFNGNSCSLCHAQPALGGSSPGLGSRQNPAPNPQIALATLHGATNRLPSFITRDGPVREARFVLPPGSSASSNAEKLDGTVYSLFTIKGRSDAEGCSLDQPDFDAELAKNNVALRIPGALFGLGLVENTADATLELNLAVNRTAKAALGIGGRLNRSSNDGTVSKFGWKAQNKSLLVFAAEAYNVEEGISNESFTNERGGVPGCVFNSTPEDTTGRAGESSDVVTSAIFMRLLAPPTPGPLTDSTRRGSDLFDTVGCALCHSRTQRTMASPFTGMSNVTYHPYSDFALHHMGATLADGVIQGEATSDEFRTAPLWGIGQRLFFLHDGRTSELGAAIEAHASSGATCATQQDYERTAHVAGPRALGAPETCSSEANAVVDGYNALSRSQQTDLLAFLRSL